MLDPTTYGLGQILTSPLVLAGIALILGGCSALLWMYRDALGYNEPEREIPTVVQPAVEQTYIHPQLAVAANYHRSDADTHVIPRIPGATPEAGLTVVEERTEEMDFAGMIAAAEAQVRAAYSVVPVPPPAAGLAPQFAALSRFFTAVDEARADTDAAMRRLAANARPDCPLTTHELVIPTVGETPVHRAIADREPTQELSKTMAKIMEAQR